MITPTFRFSGNHYLVSLNQEDSDLLSDLADENGLTPEDYGSLLMHVALEEMRSDLKELEAQEAAD